MWFPKPVRKRFPTSTLYAFRVLLGLGLPRAHDLGVWVQKYEDVHLGHVIRLTCQEQSQCFIREQRHTQNDIYALYCTGILFN